MRRYDGYAAMKTEDERYDARDLAILVHAHLDVNGYALTGATLEVGCGDHESWLQVVARKPSGSFEKVRMPAHWDIEDAIATRDARGTVTLPLDEVFDDGQRSGMETIEKAAKGLGVPTSAFGLQNIPDDTSRLERIGDALGHMAGLGMLLAPEEKDRRRIHMSFRNGTPYASLVGLNDDGSAGRRVLVDGHSPEGEHPDLAKLRRAMMACITDGPGRTYDAIQGDKDSISVNADLKIGRFESPKPADFEAALGRFMDTMDAALAPRLPDSIMGVNRVPAPQADPAVSAVRKHGGSLQSMFGIDRA